MSHSANNSRKNRLKEKLLIILTLTLLFLAPAFAFADLKTYDVDLDNDGNAEFIAVNQQFDFPDNTFPFETEGIVAVYTRPEGNKAGQFSMPDRFEKVEFVSLNKDGVKQIVAWSSGGAHYTNLTIYGYKDGDLYKIFENGSACPVETDFKAKKPMIKVGRANWKQEGWCYATGEPLWQVYVWNGKEFIYSKELSTTPEISEQEETAGYVNAVKERMQEKE